MKGTIEEVYRSLGLNDEEYQAIVAILNRPPSATELAMFSVEWSEHCGYTHSRKLLNALPRRGKFPTLVGEDSGGILIGDLAVVFKMESHNHPSHVEPKQGAATGVGGILRDIFTAGVRPVALFDSLRFGDLSQPYNKYLLRGVVEGIQFYGNCVGVPTIGGEVYFDESYNGNCLVNVMCIGLGAQKDIMQARTRGIGNSIMYVGSSTGRDGIGGCSILASNEFNAQEEKRPTVQIGDPFTEKCLIEATLEALATGFIVGIKDMGAAGLTCATSEMAAAGDTGVELELKDVPRREKGMQAWELMMSESQERMLVCIRQGKEKEIERIFKKWGLNAVVIGTVTDDKKVRIKDQGKVVAEIDAHKLTKAPVYTVKAVKPNFLNEVNSFSLADIPQPHDYSETLLALLQSGNIASKRWIYEQYDHMVQTNTVILPGSDAAVIRIKGTRKALAATTDCNSRYCFLEPFQGAQIAVAEAARNLVCTGAEPAAVTDCLNFGNPKKQDRYWYFQRCVEGIISACSFFNLPVVSGNVSFYNESPAGAIYPTPTIGMIGVVHDRKFICTQQFKRADDIIALLGDTKEELGGSEYLAHIHSLVKGVPPLINLETEGALQKLVLLMIQKELLHSAHDCAEGGLAVALAECCFSGEDSKIGAVVDTVQNAIRSDAFLFGETQSRVIISFPQRYLEEIIQLVQAYNVPFTQLGVTGGDRLKIVHNKKLLINLKIETMFHKWDRALEEALY